MLKPPNVLLVEVPPQFIALCETTGVSPQAALRGMAEKFPKTCNKMSTTVLAETVKLRVIRMKCGALVLRQSGRSHGEGAPLNALIRIELKQVVMRYCKKLRLDFCEGWLFKRL